MKPPLTPEERKELRRARRRLAMQRSKFALPNGITLLSILCGFSSVVMSLNAAADHPEHYFGWGAIFLVLAGFFDGMDGRVARLTNTASEFGVQLDSLADVVSFGMAPAILAYRYGFFELGIADPRLRAVGWAASFFFVACGAMRLARFNVQTGSVDSRFFVGMPIPAGAACVAAVVIAWPSPPRLVFHAYVFAAELFLLGLLMVSTLRFPSFKRPPRRTGTVMASLVLLASLACLLIIFPRRFFVGFFAVYIALVLMLNLAWKLGWRGVSPPSDGDAEDVTVH